MPKTLFAPLIAAALMLSAANALADATADCAPPPPQRVPDAGSTTVLLCSALTGLAGLRYFFKKKS